MKARYGSVWEKYPIREGQMWEFDHGRLLCIDLMDVAGVEVVNLLGKVDLVYVDPPWNSVQLARFYKTRGAIPSVSYLEFLIHLAGLMKRICPMGLIVIDIADSSRDLLLGVFAEAGATRLALAPSWYASGRCWLWAGSFGDQERIIMPNGMGGKKEITFITQYAAKIFGDGFSMADLCCGKGTFLMAALHSGAGYVCGVEMLERKLAHAIKGLLKAGLVDCGKRQIALG